MAPRPASRSSFRWVTRENGYDYDERVTYQMTVKPDRPPLVHLVEPPENQKATREKVAAIGYQAEDDFGLSSAEIVYSVNGGPEKRFRVQPAPSGRSVAGAATWKLAESITDLKEGDKVSFYVEVADNHPDKPNVKRSEETREYQIVSRADWLLDFLERKDSVFNRLGVLHGEETSASSTVKRLQTGEAPTSQPTSNP
jgi:hypothetical protein